jgi:hypothetical protein
VGCTRVCNYPHSPRTDNGSVKAATVRTTDSPIKECHYNRFNINCTIMQAVQIYALKSGALKSS